MPRQAPAFAEKDTCFQCNTGFGLFTRRHHCRNCGHSLCGTCLTQSTPLPHFGMPEAQKVCNKCFTDVKAGRFADKPKPKNAAPVDNTADQLAKATIEDEPTPPPPKKKVVNCTCNMPLCVCEEEEEEKPAAVPAGNTSRAAAPTQASTTSTTNTAPAKAKPNTAAGASAFASMMGGGSSRKVDLSGNLEDQCRDAIKDGDVRGATQLIEAGVDTAWKDRQGNTLLHMACMFNHTEIAMKLLAAGADPQRKNRDKESCLDIAPATLAFKMKEAMSTE